MFMQKVKALFKGKGGYIFLTVSIVTIIGCLILKYNYFTIVRALTSWAN